MEDNTKLHIVTAPKGKLFKKKTGFPMIVKELLIDSKTVLDDFEEIDEPIKQSNKGK